MEVSGGAFRAEEFRRCRKRLPGLCPALDPDLVDTLLLPVGEQADAVSRFFNFIEMSLQFAEWKVLVDILTHGEGGLNRERDGGDDAQSAQPNHGAAKGVPILIAG